VKEDVQLDKTGEQIALEVDNYRLPISNMDIIPQAGRGYKRFSGIQLIPFMPLHQRKKG
jgi:hypothetical protein